MKMINFLIIFSKKNTYFSITLSLNLLDFFAKFAFNLFKLLFFLDSEMKGKRYVFVHK